MHGALALQHFCLTLCEKWTHVLFIGFRGCLSDLMGFKQLTRSDRHDPDTEAVNFSVCCREMQRGQEGRCTLLILKLGQ